MTEENELNPYTPPGLPTKALQPVREVRVDGHCVVVSSGLQLPMRCVMTNADCSPSDQSLRTLSYAPSFQLVISRQQCHLCRCVSPASRKRYLFIRLLWTAGIFAVFWIFFGFAVIAGAIATAFFLSLPPDHLRIVNYRNGEFWIIGFNEDFLESLVNVDGWMRV